MSIDSSWYAIFSLGNQSCLETWLDLSDSIWISLPPWLESPRSPRRYQRRACSHCALILFILSHDRIQQSNVLVNDNGKACLSDFGLGRLLEVSGFTTKQVGGTCRWMAYELIYDDGEEPARHTRETDVWAFGMTILEVRATSCLDLLTVSWKGFHWQTAFFTLAIWRKRHILYSERS